MEQQQKKQPKMYAVRLLYLKKEKKTLKPDKSSSSCSRRRRVGNCIWILNRRLIVVLHVRFRKPLFFPFYFVYLFLPLVYSWATSCGCRDGNSPHAEEALVVRSHSFSWGTWRWFSRSAAIGANELFVFLYLCECICVWLPLCVCVWSPFQQLCRYHSAWNSFTSLHPSTLSLFLFHLLFLFFSLTPFRHSAFSWLSPCLSPSPCLKSWTTLQLGKGKRRKRRRRRRRRRREGPPKSECNGRSRTRSVWPCDVKECGGCQGLSTCLVLAIALPSRNLSSPVACLSSSSSSTVLGSWKWLNMPLSSSVTL